MAVKDVSKDAKKKLYKDMDSLFDKYRTCKYLTYSEEIETDDIKKYSEFCQQIEKVVNHLPDPEKAVIEERYMKDDYITDCEVFADILCIPFAYFDKRRLKAFEKLDSYLRDNYIYSEK